MVNKPPGMVVHPTKAHQEGNPGSRIASPPPEPGGLAGGVHLVNRLDKDTSGLVLVTKDPLSHQRLS